MRDEVYPLRRSVYDFLVSDVLPSLHEGEHVLEIGPMQLAWTPFPELYVAMRKRVTALGCCYESCDPDPGANAEHTCSLLELPSDVRGVDVVVACEVFEHVDRIWDIPGLLYRVLRPGGRLFFTMPYYFYHHHPFPDYWRLSKEAIELLFAPYFELHIRELGTDDACKPLQYLVMGVRR